MMKRVKFSLLMVLVLCMTIGLLSCRQKDSTNPSESTEPAETWDRFVGKDVAESGLVFELNADGTSYTVIDYNSTSPIVEIPETYKGLPVNKIGNHAFYVNDAIYSVTIPSSVTSVGECAFCLCDRLVEVYNFSPMKVVAGRGGYGNLAYYARDVYTTKVESKLRIDENGFVFYEDENELVLIDYVGNATELMIPDGVTTLGYVALKEHLELERIVLPNSVTTLEAGVFVRCENLKSIELGTGLTSISEYTFGNCKSLTEVTIPNSVTSIGESAFHGCESLTAITLPSGITTIEKAMFSYCKNLTAITIPVGVTMIGEWAFAGCDNLVEITLPEGVTTINKSAFADCEKLTSITIPSGVTMIDFDVFKGCTMLTDLTYRGTKEQWQTLMYEHGFCEEIEKLTIHCADGDILPE